MIKQYFFQKIVTQIQIDLNRNIIAGRNLMNTQSRISYLYMFAKFSRKRILCSSTRNLSRHVATPMSAQSWQPSSGRNWCETSCELFSRLPRLGRARSCIGVRKTISADIICRSELGCQDWAKIGSSADISSRDGHTKVQLLARSLEKT